MGCNNSARLAFELQTAKQEIRELQESLKIAEEMKNASQQEVAKAKEAMMTLTSENEKLAYELHVTKNSDYQNSSAIFESTKEEFQKMKMWTELEIKRVNEILSALLSTNLVPKEDDRHQHILRLIDDMHDNEYDPVKLFELGKLRFNYIDELMDELTEFRNKMMIQLKAVEATTVTVLAKCQAEGSREVIATLTQAPALTKLVVIRDLLKRVGLPESMQEVTAPDLRQLELQVEELTAQVQLQAETIETLKSARASQPPNAMQLRIAELEGNLAAANSELTQKMSELNATKAVVSELQDEVRMLQSKLKVLQDTSAAGSDVQTLRDTVANLTATGEKLVMEAESVKEKLLAHKEKASEVTDCARKVRENEESLDTLVSAVEELEAMLGAAVA